MVISAQIEDIPSIVDLRLKSYEEQSVLEYYHQNLHQQLVDKYIYIYKSGLAQHFLIKENESIISIAGAFIKDDIPFCFLKNDSYGYLGDVYTCPQYRQKGYATLLVNSAMDWLKAKGVHMVRLLASSESKKMYEKMGFKPTKEMSFWFPEKNLEE